jgi:stage II sporulation protein AA (anti-sigma F factor antagonist)
MEEPGVQVNVVDGVVCVAGEIDMSSAACLDRALTAAEPPMMVDMSGVSFMDASGLNVLLAHYCRLVGQGGVRRVVAVSAAVELVLRVTGLTQMLTDEARPLATSS